ncbi:MAG: hypothetical protein R3F59_22200 [Myxococcota bacterium]
MSDRFANPFYVLELPASAGAIDVERAAHKVMAMLSVHYAGADRFPSPLGPRPRDAELVRWAAAELRDPDKRQVWAAQVLPVGDVEPPPDPLAPWEDALEACGWGRR